MIARVPLESDRRYFYEYTGDVLRKVPVEQRAECLLVWYAFGDGWEMYTSGTYALLDFDFDMHFF